MWEGGGGGGVVGEGGGGWGWGGVWRGWGGGGGGGVGGVGLGVGGVVVGLGGGGARTACTGPKLPRGAGTLLLFGLVTGSSVAFDPRLDSSFRGLTSAVASRDLVESDLVDSGERPPPGDGDTDPSASGVATLMGRMLPRRRALARSPGVEGGGTTCASAALARSAPWAAASSATRRTASAAVSPRSASVRCRPVACSFERALIHSGGGVSSAALPPPPRRDSDRLDRNSSAWSFNFMGAGRVNAPPLLPGAADSERFKGVLDLKEGAFGDGAAPPPSLFGDPPACIFLGFGRSGLGGLIASATPLLVTAGAAWGGDTRARSFGPRESGDGLTGRLGVFCLGLFVFLLLEVFGFFPPGTCGLPGLREPCEGGVLLEAGCASEGFLLYLGPSHSADAFVFAPAPVPVGGFNLSTALPVLPRFTPPLLLAADPPPSSDLLTSTCLEPPLTFAGGGGRPAAPVVPFKLTTTFRAAGVDDPMLSAAGVLGGDDDNS